jgi:hypothetical protein
MATSLRARETGVFTDGDQLARQDPAVLAGQRCELRHPACQRLGRPVLPVRMNKAVKGGPAAPELTHLVDGEPRLGLVEGSRLGERQPGGQRHRRCGCDPEGTRRLRLWILVLLTEGEDVAFAAHATWSAGNRVYPAGMSQDRKSWLAADASRRCWTA